MNSVPKKWKDCSLLTSALKQVKSTLRELDLSVDLYDHLSDVVEFAKVRPIRGQLELRELSCLLKLKAPIAMLLGWSSDAPLVPLEEVVPAGLTHLGLTEDFVAQCTYEWKEELVLEALAAILSVWDCVTPDLQVMEFWLSRDDNRWEEAKLAQLRVMCKEAGVLCILHWHMEPMTSCSPTTFPWVRQGPPLNQLQLSNRVLKYPKLRRIPDNVITNPTWSRVS
jgi:hypothetical protein